jgi:hypothetical protein
MSLLRNQHADARYQRLLEEELAIVQLENQCLKALKKLEDVLRALKTAVRRHRGGNPEDELAALRAQNCRLKEKKLLEEWVARLHTLGRQLQVEKQSLLDKKIHPPSTTASRDSIVGEWHNVPWKVGPTHQEVTESEEDRRSKASPSRNICALSPKEIRVVRSAEDPYSAAMQYVDWGKATLIEFLGDEVVARSGDPLPDRF